MNFLKFSTFTLTLLSASFNAFADDYQDAYALCARKNGLLIVDAPSPQLQRALTPYEQAKLCIPWLKQNAPFLASKIDLTVWKQGILDQKYKR